MSNLELEEAPLEITSDRAPTVDDFSYVPSAANYSKERPGSPGMRVGRLVAIQDNLVPFVLFPGRKPTAAIAARTIVMLSTQDIGRDVLISYIDNDLNQPVVMGCLRDESARADGVPHTQIGVDGKTLEVTAKEEIVLRCGKSSITLTRAGKIIIRGTYVISRSSGVNRIKGGTVEIN